MKKLFILLFLFLTTTCFASQQVITGADTSISATTFSSPQGLTTGGTNESRNSLYVTTSGTISNLRVEVDTAPGAGKSWTFTVNNNTVATALACTISDTATSCNDTDSFSVVATDSVSIDPSSSGTPAAAGAQWSVIFDGSTTAESIYSAGTLSANLSTTTTQYLTFGGISGAIASSEANSRTIASTSGTIKNLYVVLETAPGSGATRTFTLRKNGTSQTLTCPISGASATTCSDTSNSFTVVAGDSFSLMSEVSITAPAASLVEYGITFTADTNGEFMFLDGSNAGNPFSTSATNYIPISDADYVPGTTETAQQTLVNACSITSMSVQLNGSPGAGTSYTFTLRKNAEDVADITCQIAGTDTTCSDTGNTSLSNDDNMATEVTPAGTPTARTGRVTYTGYIAPIVSAYIQDFIVTPDATVYIQ